MATLAGKPMAKMGLDWRVCIPSYYSHLIPRMLTSTRLTNRVELTRGGVSFKITKIALEVVRMSRKGQTLTDP
jgi:hypothetical protein